MGRLTGAALAVPQVVIPNLAGGKDLDVTIQRGDFERLCADLFDGCSALAERLLQWRPPSQRRCFAPAGGGAVTPPGLMRRQASIVAADLSDVVMVGGGTQMPGVQRALMSAFPRHAGRARPPGRGGERGMHAGAAMPAHRQCAGPACMCWRGRLRVLCSCKPWVLHLHVRHDCHGEVMAYRVYKGCSGLCMWAALTNTVWNLQCVARRRSPIG